MSPILVRPVREQFEHDRIIRLLQVRYRRKFDVAINPGAEQNASVTVGELAMYPDLVLFSTERGRRLQGTIEVETGESVNTLEAMAEWGPFSRLRVPFFLYVPPAVLDTARRLCNEHHVNVSEIWTYHTAPDQVRFMMVHRAPESQQVIASKAPREAAPKAPALPKTATAAKAVASKAAKGPKSPRRVASKVAKRSAARTPARPQMRAAKSSKSAKVSKSRAAARRR
ncbi:MAG TPA: hypothetical protein VEK56_04735 [Vicinamibacterales bacterium]|nr:hypothetical protein [Vicinamibacterales bacterium]